MRPADEMPPILCEKRTGSPVQGYGKMSAEISVGDDATPAVPEQQGFDGAALGVMAEKRSADFAGPELVLAAHESFHPGQSFPGCVYAARAGTDTRSRSGSQTPVSQPP